GILLRHGTQGASLGAWPAAFVQAQRVPLHPNVSRRSAHPSIRVSVAKVKSPGRRNASREREWLFDMVREIVARIERSEIRGRWLPHFAALNAGYEATSCEEPTFTCGRIRSIVSGLLFTMKTATRTCEPSARGMMELGDSVRAVSSLTVRSNAWARHKLMLVPARQIGHMSRFGAAAQGLRRGRRRDMRLGYFTMPVHPMHPDWAETLKEDREAIILADKLGFYDAFMGEHLTDACETITNSMMFHATLIPATTRIKLATGTSNLSQMHPVLIAVQAAMFDHLAEGRFILGVSPGALTTDAEALGILDEDRNKMFAEAIDVILAIWEREPPYDIDLPDNRYKVSTARTMTLDLGVGIMARPYQKPRPEIVGTVVAPFSPGVVQMGKRDFHPLSANFLLSKHL